jgi:hypothetical protein
VPVLRRKLPAAPTELEPVPPLSVGTMPSAIVGVIVGFATTSGLTTPTLVTVPPPAFPSDLPEDLIQAILNARRS